MPNMAPKKEQAKQAVTAHLGARAPQAIRDMFSGLGNLVLADCCGAQLDLCECRKIVGEK